LTGAPRPRRRALSDEEAEEVAVAPKGHLVGPAINEYLTTSGFGRVIRLSALLDVWEATVDEDVAAHCRPMRFEGEDLVVEVDHQGWVIALTFREADLLARLGVALGERITGRLKAYVGSDPA
jgi:predicted nucleic acid-binding Zn ribbon protein